MGRTLGHLLPNFRGFGSLVNLGGVMTCCGCLHEQYWKSLGHGRPDILLLENHGDSDLETEARAVWVNSNSLNLKANASVLYKYPPLKTNSKHSLKIVEDQHFLVFSRPISYFQGTLEHGDVRTKFVSGISTRFRFNKFWKGLDPKLIFGQMSRSAIRDPRRGKRKDNPIARGPKLLDSCW